MRRCLLGECGTAGSVEAIEGKQVLRGYEGKLLRCKYEADRHCCSDAPYGAALQVQDEGAKPDEGEEAMHHQRWADDACFQAPPSFAEAPRRSDSRPMFPAFSDENAEIDPWCCGILRVGAVPLGNRLHGVGLGPGG